MKNVKNSIRLVGFLAMRICLGGVFAWAGLVKLLEPEANLRAYLYSYEIIPVFLVPLIAAVLPWMEWLLGVFVLLGYGLRWSSLSLGLLSFCFAAGILLSGKLGLDASHSCGCFGESGPQLSFQQVFLLDLTNAFFGFLLWKINPLRFSLDSKLLRPAK